MVAPGGLPDSELLKRGVAEKGTGVRSARRARRREGYPPEGPRPRSGLGRVARSRSDAPRLTDPSGTPFTIICTADCITTGTVVGSEGKLAIITGGSAIGTGV